MEVIMNKKNCVKMIALFIAPLFLFAILLLPYSWLNSAVIVDVFGCGCTEIDESGKLITYSKINANDVTALFWMFVAICATVLAIFISIKKIPREKSWLRVVYVVGIFVISLFIAYSFSQMMLWK